MSVATSHLWAVSCVAALAVVPCFPLFTWIGDAHHYRHAVEPLLASSPEATAVLERWARRDDLDARSILSTSRVFQADLDGFRLRILLSKYDSYGPELLFDDQRAYNLTHHRVRDGGLILDVGGNVGVTAILLAKVNAGARVVSFEPLPQNRLYLELNLALNGLSGGRVEVRSEAIAAERGAARMSYNPEVPAASGRYWASSGVFDRSLEQVFVVNRTTVGDVLDGLGASRIDLLKLDCEGCEYEVVPLLSNATLDSIGYAIGDVHLHYAHLFSPEKSRLLHAALCGRGWGITHMLCSPGELEPLLGLLRQAQHPPEAGSEHVR